MRAFIIFMVSLGMALCASAEQYSNSGCHSRRHFKYIGPKSSVNIVYSMDDLKWKTEDSISYSTSFAFPTAWLNRQVLLGISSAGHAYTLYVNGEKCGYCQSNATPMTFNVTQQTVTGKNVVTLTMDPNAATESLFRTSTTGVGRTGIICQPTIRIRDIICSTELNEAGDGILDIGLVVKCDALGTKSARYDITISDRDTVLGRGYRTLELDMKREDTVHFSCRIPQERLWSPASATMLTLSVESRIENRMSERISIPVGARKLSIRKGTVSINNVTQAVVTKAVSTIEEIVSAHEAGCSCVTITCDGDIEPLLDKCDSEGMMAVICCSVDTSSFDSRNDKRSNPAYLPQFVGPISDRVIGMHAFARSHPSVIGYIIGRGRHAGYGIYEAFVNLAGRERNAAIMYDGFRGPWSKRSISMTEKE